MTAINILILGGYGYTGAVIAQLLVQETDARVIVAGRSLEKASRCADQLNAASGAERVIPRQVDAASPEGLQQGLRGADLLVVASSTSQYARQVARAALKAGIDTLDIQYSRQKTRILRELAGEIEQAGLCFVTDGGFHPGLPGALARYAGQRLEQLSSARVGSVIKIDWCQYPPSPTTAQEMVAEFLDFDADVFKAGRWQKARWAGMSETIWMDFGAPFGRQYAIHMLLEEMRGIPAMFPTLRDCGFYVGGFNWFTDWIAFPVIMAGMAVAPKRLLSPAARFLDWSLRSFSRPPYDTRLKLEALGMRNGKPAGLNLCLRHADGYWFTAIPTVATLLQMLDGSARKVGLWTQAHMVDPARLLKDMQRMGVEVNEEMIDRGKNETD